MSAEELTNFVFGRINRSKMDIWDHSAHMRQNFRLIDFKSLQREFEPLQGLIKFLKDPYNLKSLDFEAMHEYFDFNWKKVFGIRPGNAEEVSLAHQTKQPVSVQTVQPFPIEIMFKPRCYVNNVTTRLQAKAGDICPEEPHMLVDTKYVSNCKHYKLALSHNGHFPTTHFKKFCENQSH